MSLFQTLAKEFAAAFTTDNPRKVWTLKDDAPEWMRDAMRDAHFDGRLPDDWIYEHARAIVCTLSERESVDGDDSHEICDGLVDIYTTDLTAWLASHLGNVALVDEARTEGLTEGCDLDGQLKAAQYMALTYMCGALVSAIESHADDMAPEYYAAHECEICDPIDHCTHGVK